MQHDAAAGDVDQGVGSAQVDADVARQLETTKEHRHRSQDRRIIGAFSVVACYTQRLGWNSLKAVTQPVPHHESKFRRSIVYGR